MSRKRTFALGCLPLLVIGFLLVAHQVQKAKYAAKKMADK